MAKSKLTKEQKKWFNAGRISYYNEVRPKIEWEAVPTRTTFNADGSIYARYEGLGVACADMNTAKGYAEYRNERESTQNKRVMAAVKAKKVNEYNSNDCTTETWRVVAVSRRARLGEHIQGRVKRGKKH